MSNEDREIVWEMVWSLCKLKVVTNKGWDEVWRVVYE